MYVNALDLQFEIKPSYKDFVYVVLANSCIFKYYASFWFCKLGKRNYWAALYEKKERKEKGRRKEERGGRGKEGREEGNEPFAYIEGHSV